MKPALLSMPQAPAPSFLRGKRVMLIAANFFRMPQRIIDALRRLGAEVDFFDERPGNGFIDKAMIRINRRIMKPRIDAYYGNILRQTASRSYDYILMIKGECVSTDTLRRMRELHPGARMLLYQWDAIAYNPRFHTIRSHFDKVMSFDAVDCKAYGPEFVPLFYPPEFAAVADMKERLYDLTYVGTIHTRRYPLVCTLAERIEARGGTMLRYLYFPHRLLYLKERWLNPAMAHTNKSLFHFDALSDEELTRLYGLSRGVLDIAKEGQQGLSFRPFETLGAKRKLITTNASVAEYDFYRPENILIIDPAKPEIPADFLRRRYRPLPDELYRSYSIDSWLAAIFA